MLKLLKSFFQKSEISPEYWNELEEALLASDVGMPVTQKIIESVKGCKTVAEVREKLSQTMHGMLRSHRIAPVSKPHIIMVVGVNGTGKTTTIAKLAYKFKNEGKIVMLVAADTFRAAAIEQLKIWGDRLGLSVVAQKQDSDPAAVAFDGIKSAVAKGVDIVILDTAGRLHTNKNLMEELSKVGRVAGKALDGAPHDIILVIDATVGGNGLIQAKTFNDALGLTSVILAKMDGTAKGGVIFSVSEELDIPVSFMGLGEGLDDLPEFSKDAFISDIIG